MFFNKEGILPMVTRENFSLESKSQKPIFATPSESEIELLLSKTHKLARAINTATQYISLEGSIPGVDIRTEIRKKVSRMNASVQDLEKYL